MIGAPSAAHDRLGAIDRAIRSGRREEAAALCDAGLASDVRDHRLHNARAAVQRASGAIRSAAHCYARAIALAPAEAIYYVNFANALLANDRPRLARRLVLSALRLKRDDAAFRLVLVECLYRERRLDAAEAVLAPLAASRPHDARVQHAQGALCLKQSLYRRAASAFRRCLALAPDHARAQMNMATAARYLGETERALRLYESAEQRDPNDRLVPYLRACTLLAAGRLSEGWDGYESRWRFPGFPSPQRRTGRPRWDGVPRAGTQLLVWPEQGVGEQICHAGCVPDLSRTGQPFVLECDPRLVPLFRHSFAGTTVRPVTHDGAGREGVSTGSYDFHLPIASLPRLFRRSLDAFPAHGGYLRPPAAAVGRWRRAMDALGPGLKVGVSWRSSNMSGDRASYYAPLDAWRPVLAESGVTFVNLQYDTRPDDRSTFRERFGLDLAEWPDLDLKDDFLGVAALMQALDVVVSGPSSVADLAGAVGRPTWVFGGPPTFFKYLGTDRMPWYPSWKLFTKREWGDTWDEAFDRIAAALRARAAAAG